MAVARIQAVNGSGISATLGLTGVAAGSLLVCEARVGALGATVSVSDDVNGTWTLAASQAQATDGFTSYVFFFPVSAAGNPTITLSASAGSARFNASEWSGAASSPLGLVGSGQGASPPVSSGSIAVSVGDLVFGAMANDRSVGSDWVAGGTSAGGSWAINCDYSEVGHAIASEYVIATATGSFSAAPTDDNSSGHFANVTTIVVQFASAPSSTTVMLPMGMLGTGRV